MRATVTAALLILASVAAFEALWLYKQSQDIDRLNADLRIVANMVSDLKIAAKVKE